MAGEKMNTRIITILSIGIPLVVVVMFSVRIQGVDFSFLPPIYASINALTSILLISAFVAIKSGRRKVHETLMKTNLMLSASFLVMYVLYHMTSDPASFGGEGPVRLVYFTLLISHITLSVAVIPLVLITYARARAEHFDRHKALAKFAFPVWLYVTTSGVIVYLMISPYYP